jgi:hypothetical protein
MILVPAAFLDYQEPFSKSKALHSAITGQNIFKYLARNRGFEPINGQGIDSALKSFTVMFWATRTSVPNHLEFGVMWRKDVYAENSIASKWWRAGDNEINSVILSGERNELTAVAVCT